MDWNNNNKKLYNKQDEPVQTFKADFSIDKKNIWRN